MICFILYVISTSNSEISNKIIVILKIRVKTNPTWIAQNARNENDRTNPKAGGKR